MQKKNKLSSSIKALIVGAIIAGAGLLIGLIAFLVVGFKVENFATNLVQTKEHIKRMLIGLFRRMLRSRRMRELSRGNI